MCVRSTTIITPDVPVSRVLLLITTYLYLQLLHAVKPFGTKYRVKPFAAGTFAFYLAHQPEDELKVLARRWFLVQDAAYQLVA